jgi:hypothetical protein
MTFALYLLNSLDQPWSQSGFFLLASSIVLLLGFITDVRIGVKRWIQNAKHSTTTSSRLTPPSPPSDLILPGPKRSSWLGAAKTASFGLLMSLIIVGGVSGISSAAWMRASAKANEPKPSPIAATAATAATAAKAAYPFITIGCDPDKLSGTQCPTSMMVYIVAEWWDDTAKEWLYKIGYKSVSMGYIEPTLRQCSAQVGSAHGQPIYYRPPWRPGDFALFIRYEDHSDEGCISILPDAAGTMLRRTNGKTDSEMNDERVRQATEGGVQRLGSGK